MGRKKLNFGVVAETWPAVFGNDGAGVVENVGNGGDGTQSRGRDVGLFGHAAWPSAFQEIATVPKHFAAKKTANLPLEQAALLP